MSHHLIQIIRFGSFREAYQKTDLVVCHIFFYVNQMGKFWLYGTRNDIIPASIVFWGQKAGSWMKWKWEKRNIFTPMMHGAVAWDHGCEWECDYGVQ